MKDALAPWGVFRSLLFLLVADNPPVFGPAGRVHVTLADCRGGQTRTLAFG